MHHLLVYYVTLHLVFYLVFIVLFNVNTLNILIYVLNFFLINPIMQVWRTRKEPPLSCLMLSSTSATGRTCLRSMQKLRDVSGSCAHVDDADTPSLGS